MALSYLKRETFKRFSKLKMLEHDLALSSEKNLKIKLVRPLRNLQKHFCHSYQQISPPLNHNLSGSVGRAQDALFAARCGVGSNPSSGAFGRFFFIIGEKGWAHPKVFRLPHP